MKSLKVKIYNRLTFLTEGKEKWEYNKCRDDILKLVEEKIDEKIKHIESLPNLYEDTAHEYGLRLLNQLKEILK